MGIGDQGGSSESSGGGGEHSVEEEVPRSQDRWLHGGLPLLSKQTETVKCRCCEELARAVLFASIISIAVSCILFLKPKKLIKTFNEILTSPHLISIFSIIVVLGLIFIFKGFKVNLFIKSEYVDEVKIYKPKKKKKFELWI